MFKPLLLLLTLLGACSAQAQGVQEVEDDRILSFETSPLPFVAAKASKLSLSDAHYKHGQYAVRWAWTARGAQLRLSAPVDYLPKNPDPRQTSVSTFAFWVYSPAAVEGSLRFEFRKRGRTCAWFDYRLGFTGWRGAWVAFDRDMQGRPEQGMDELLVTVDGPRRGELFFDHFILSSFQDIRHHTADFQAPFINAATRSHWLVLLRSWQLPLPARTEPLTAAERRDMDTIERRLCRLLTEGRRPMALKQLRKRFAEMGIAENADGTLCGKPIWFVRYAETYLNLGHPKVADLYRRSGQLLRRYNDLLFQVAVAHRAADDASARNELARIYVLLTRHLLDQGFAAGSAQGTLHHLGYSMRNFYTAPVLMRGVLREAGLLEEVQLAMEWFSGVGEVKRPPERPGIDIDAFNTSLIGRLASILLREDTPEKAVWMACFSRWADNGYKTVEGTAPCLKSDGTVFHHRHHYPAYAVGGFDGAVDAVWLLGGTRFGISPEGRENLKKALLEMRFYCNLRSFPLALSGRHPDGRGELVPWHYARLAEAGTPDGREAVDPELAAAYLRLAAGEDRYTRRFRAAGIAAEPSPAGHRVYGYNASAAHRRGDWLLTVAGHSRYLWSAEIYRGANHYGRYLTHGSLQLLADGDPVDSRNSGFMQEGWDWRHIPGTTALEIPMERMKADIRNVDTVSGSEEMLLSDEAFAGGVSHRGQNGLFAMKLHEHDKYNGSLRARKSWFFFGSRVVALGSNIENAAPGRVHTTLFQNYLSHRSDPIRVDGDTVAAFPYRATLSSGGVLVDNLHNAYFVPRGEVVVTRLRQHSLHEESDAPTENDFTTAWIDHGGVIRNGGYEYMLAVHATESEIAAYGRRLPYEVLRCDSAAHVVRDRPSGITAYALFEAVRVDAGRLVEVSLPSLVMIGGGDEELTVSVCDPDLRFYEGPSDERFDAEGRRIERSIYSREWIDSPSIASRLRLVLRGRWRLAEPSPDCRATAAGERTELEFTCREGATREVKLMKN